MTRAAALAAALTLVSLATAHASGEWEHSAVYDIVHDDEPFLTWATRARPQP